MHWRDNQASHMLVFMIRGLFSSTSLHQWTQDCAFLCAQAKKSGLYLLPGLTIEERIKSRLASSNIPPTAPAPLNSASSISVGVSDTPANFSTPYCYF